MNTEMQSKCYMCETAINGASCICDRCLDDIEKEEAWKEYEQNLLNDY